MQKIFIGVLAIILTLSMINAQPTLEWAKSIEGTSYDHSNSITIDTSGNTIITGWYSYTADFDPGSSVFNMTPNGSEDIFIQKLNSNGDFVWAKSIGGNATDFGNSITTDNSGNIYLTGFYRGTVDFDPGAGIFNLTAYGITSNIFVLKLDANGNFVWAKSMGSTYNDEGNSIALDNLGNIYTAGFFRDVVDFDPGAGIFNLSSPNNDAVFIQKLDNNGNFVWAKMIDGLANIQVRDRSMEIDVNGNIYLAGYFTGTVDFDPGTTSYNLTGSNDAFILKLDDNGNFVWVKSMSGTPYSITSDGFGNIYTTGWYSGSADMDPSSATFSLPYTSTRGTFIQKLNPSGNFVWAKALNGQQPVASHSITIDNVDNLYVTGYYNGGIDFDPGTGTFVLTAVGADDIFTLKLDNNGVFIWAISMGGTGVELGNSIITNTHGDVYLTGNFSGISDFDPSIATSYLYATSNRDIFIQKLNQSAVGIEENTILSRINIYPNPTSYQLTINNNEKLIINDIYILDITGKTIKKITEELVNLDVTDLSSGIYFIKFITVEKTIIRKFIKQ